MEKSEHNNHRETELHQLKQYMDDFAREREKLNHMSEQRIALGKSLTDGEVLRQNELCSSLSMDIMKLQEMLEELPEEE